jgi:hypothetical protein
MLRGPEGGINHPHYHRIWKNNDMLEENPQHPVDRETEIYRYIYTDTATATPS